MEPRTHLELDPSLCGAPAELSAGHARVELTPPSQMRADDHQLVHGGFVFGLADHAAMLAVNEPTVVLGSAEVRFSAPVTVGQRCVAEATVSTREGSNHIVDVTVRCDGTEVFSGRFVCFVPRRHVLDRSDA